MKKAINKLFNIIKLLYKFFIVSTEGKKVTIEDVQRILHRYAPTSKIHIADSEYYLPKYSMMEKIVKLMPVKYMKYEKEKHDCDDFALIFMATVRLLLGNFAVGEIWTQTHALNFFIDERERVWLVEPQTNKIFRPSSKEIYRFIRI